MQPFFASKEGQKQFLDRVTRRELLLQEAGKAEDGRDARGGGAGRQSAPGADDPGAGAGRDRQQGEGGGEGRRGVLQGPPRRVLGGHGARSATSWSRTKTRPRTSRRVSPRTNRSTIWPRNIPGLGHRRQGGRSGVPLAGTDAPRVRPSRLQPQAGRGERPRQDALWIPPDQADGAKDRASPPASIRSRGSSSDACWKSGSRSGSRPGSRSWRPGPRSPGTSRSCRWASSVRRPLPRRRRRRDSKPGDKS